MKRALAFSSHADDLVFSASQWMSGRPDVVAVTVLAGDPPPELKLTPYDSVCGFESSLQAIQVRRAEDAEAMSVLSAKYIPLEFQDSQYSVMTEAADIAVALGELIDEFADDYVVGPVGALHPDHILVRDALLEATRGRHTPLYLYEDVPARVQHPESITKALDELRGRGYKLELEFIGTGPIASKLDALMCYRSQLSLPEFANRHELLVGERFWRISQ